MNTIQFQQQSIPVLGAFLKKGDKARKFELLTDNLSSITNDNFMGKNVILNIFLSIDTQLCANSVREFNRLVARVPNTEVLCISIDTPFAMVRFCEMEGLDYVTTASCFRSPSFQFDYGVQLSDSILEGFTARAVVCLNTVGVVVHSELAHDLAAPIDYQKAIQCFK